jgi:hypothetical protein
VRSRARLVLGVLGVLGAGACSSPSRSFVKLTLSSADPTPISGVTAVVVTVTQGASLMQTLTYRPPSGEASITIDQVTTTDLSVSFSGGQSGTVGLAVEVRDTFGCAIGAGSTTALIRKGDIATAAVALLIENGCAGDAGADGATSDAFPGCDPAMPVCTMATQTCQVNCATHVGECVAGGTGGPGATCKTNADCAPGSQCFDYASTGCGVKVCLKFCNNDRGCGAAPVSSPADGGAADVGGGDARPADAATGGAAVGARSLCLGPVQCAGGAATAYHTCTFACDPREAAATARTSGCPTGLSCLVVASMDQVDCSCAESTRTGTDGKTCVGSIDCAPGFICNLMGAARNCRSICRCDAQGMTCLAANECSGGKTCSALTNDTTFGVCL